ncbi:MAG: hypothetical protein JO112_17275 [Planctomycetes bacterium]|nr:hypothetical protein [Planctomycetota bacterium]
MKQPKKKIPSVAPGVVIGVSVLAMFGMMAVMVVLTLAGLGMVLSWFFTKDASIWLLLVGLFMVFLGPAAIALGIYRMRIKERLILAPDRLQMVRRVQDEDQVLLQVPYANISAIQFEHGTQRNYIGIDVADLADPNTYSKNNDFPTIKNIRGFHVVIDPGYTQGLAFIYAMIVERMKACQEEADS